MNQYNLVTGEPMNSPRPLHAFVDPNQRYQQMQSMNQARIDKQYQQASGMVYQFGGAGYNGQPIIPFANPMVQQYQQPRYYDRIEHIPGYNPAGTDLLLPVGFDEMVEQLQLEMEVKNDVAVEKRNQRYQGMFNYGSNYYGWNYNYPDQTVLSEYRKKAMDIRNQAVQSRINLNKRLSALVHNYMGTNLEEEQLSEIYEGYDRTVKAAQVQYFAQQDWLYQLQPVSNAYQYQQHFKQVHDSYMKAWGSKENPSMQEFLEAQGIVKISEDMEEEMHKRKDGTQFYQGDPFKRILRKSILEREGISEPDITTSNGIQFPQFSTLQQSARLMDDGALTINMPSWVGAPAGRSIQLNNELEQHFQENRNKFLQSIYAQGGG